MREEGPLLIMNGGEDPCVNCEMRTYEAPALSLNGGASYTIVGRKTPTREEMQHDLDPLQALNTNIGVTPRVCLRRLRTRSRDEGKPRTPYQS